MLYKICGYHAKEETYCVSSGLCHRVVWQEGTNISDIDFDFDFNRNMVLGPDGARHQE
jgi:hypothetical protein